MIAIAHLVISGHIQNNDMMHVKLVTVDGTKTVTGITHILSYGVNLK